MFTYKDFDRRAPEIRLTLHYKEEEREDSENPFSLISKRTERDVVVLITAIFTGTQYAVNTEEKKFPLTEDDPVECRFFKMHATELQTVFDYVALFLIKDQLILEYSLLSPRFYEKDEGKSYILVSDFCLGTDRQSSEDKLWRYLRLLKGMSVEEYRTESL